MIKALTPDDGGSGEAEGRDSRGQLQSPRQRAAHYRKYATQFRVLADREENVATREKLLQIVRQYEETAASLEDAPNPTGAARGRRTS